MLGRHTRTRSWCAFWIHVTQSGEAASEDPGVWRVMLPLQPCCLMQSFLTPNQEGPQASLTLPAAPYALGALLLLLHPCWQKQVSLLQEPVTGLKDRPPVGCPALPPTTHPQEH